MLRAFLDAVTAAVRPAAAPPADGRSPHWPAVRAAHLRAHPACAACGGTKRLNVHHLKPFHVWPALELDDRNLLTLCEGEGHHFLFGHLLDWKSWNVDAAADAAAWLARIRTRPYPPKG